MLGALFPTLTAQELELFRGLEDCVYLAVAELEERLRPSFAGLPQPFAIGDDCSIAGTVQSSHFLCGPGAVIEPTAVLVGGPIVLGARAVIRAGAYVRGPAFIGEGAVVGHASEVKNSILLSSARAPHFAFVGDSILGHDANLGAGTKLSNLRFDGRPVILHWHGQRLATGMRKLGALIGERAQTGCNAVLNPGTILMPRAVVAPGIVARGTVSGPSTL